MKRDKVKIKKCAYGSPFYGQWECRFLGEIGIGPTPRLAYLAFIERLNRYRNSI